MEWSGGARRGAAWPGEAVTEWRGQARPGMAVAEGHGEDRPDEAWRGLCSMMRASLEHEAPGTSSLETETIMENVIQHLYLWALLLNIGLVLAAAGSWAFMLHLVFGTYRGARLDAPPVDRALWLTVNGTSVVLAVVTIIAWHGMLR